MRGRPPTADHRHSESELSDSGRPSAVGGLVAPTTDALSFATTYAAKRDEWQARLGKLAADGKRGVVWGAGSKGVTFLNATGAGEEIVAVVDINPRKQGKYVAGTGQPIVAPAQLADIRPDFVIIMNANYREEIGGMLAEMSVAAEILVA